MTVKLASMKTLAARRDARLKQCESLKPFIAGSLAKVGVKCGNPNCKCASGERHEAWVLTRKEKGRTVTFHVPRDMVQEVALWVAEHKRLKKVMKEVSSLGEQMIKTFVKAGRAAAQNRARATSNRPTRSTKPSSSSPSSTPG